MTGFKAVASTAVIAGMMLVAVSGCEKGSAEKAGERIDESVEEIGKSLGEAADSIQDAGEAVAD